MLAMERLLFSHALIQIEHCVALFTKVNYLYKLTPQVILDQLVLPYLENVEIL